MNTNTDTISIKRTGTIRSMDATRTVHTTLLVRELTDGSVEYLIGDSARRADGWASVPVDVIHEIRWDSTQITGDTITDEQIRHLRDEAVSAGDLDQVAICERALQANAERETALRWDAEGHHNRAAAWEDVRRAESCRQRCADVIIAARAQEVEEPL